MFCLSVFFCFVFFKKKKIVLKIYFDQDFESAITCLKNETCQATGSSTLGTGVSSEG